MDCPGCGHANPERAKFCLECGTPLAVRCAGCGTELPPAAKFCLECGVPVGVQPSAPAAAAGAEARKVVSIVFADLVGSTALHERLDAESARRLMERYYAALRGAVETHGGTVVKLLGDGVMAAFGLRQVAEDDAWRAVRAGVAMQAAFRALVGEQAALGAAGLRVAVNTGEVVVSGAHDDLIGDPVNVAARLQEQGRDGDVVVGEATRRLVATRVTLEPLGSLALKGRAESVAAYRVASLEPPAGTAAAPFVGRAEELARLDAVYAAAVATPAARLAVLLGSPGLGKSRLIDECARRHGETATLLAAHCDAAGGATFAPLAAALRAHLGLEDAADPEALRAAVEAALAGDDADRARIAGGITALLSGSPASPEETFFVVRRFLAGQAQTRPVLLVIDDLHWAEPLLLDLVEHLVQWGAGMPLFVLVGARPELRDLRSTLGTPGGLVADVVTLTGLDAGAAMRLAANVIGAADLPAAVAAKVLATSEGNPLFVGELVRMLVQEGALAREGDRWIVGANLAALEMPPTIHALLAARIERLRAEEREVLERAAVVGRHFSRSAVAALLPRPTADLDARLEALRRGELIERDSGWLLGEPVLRFHHVLIRDAAYRRLLKGTRAELHERLADWIEAQVGDAAEHDETIGWHLEQAHQLLGELGPLDSAGTALGARAAARLAAAGRRALAGDDVPLAASLLGRAIAGLDRDDPARAELALDWCEALLAAGDVAQATVAIDELGRNRSLTTDNLTTNNLSQRLSAWHTCFAGQLTVLTAPAALQATAASLAAAAAELTALGDAAGEAKAHSVHAQALARLGRVGACEAALDRALAAARRGGDRRRANAVLAGAPLAALWGPSPVTRASGRCLDVVRVLRITQGAPAVEAVALSCQGVLEALRGRTDAARRMLAAARQMVEELGIAHRLHETDVFAGRIAAMEGDTATAGRLLRAAYDGLRELGLGIDAARAGALLARVLLAQDRAAEAEALSHESEALAGDDLQAAIAWRGARAEALARRGEHAAAIELAQAAVAIAAATDALLDHADARLALAAALRAAGRVAEADAEERRAIELWEAKGASLLAERARIAPRPRAAASVGTGSALPSSPFAGTRRVCASAATHSIGRFESALAARDGAALAGAFDESLHVVHHPTGATYGRREMLATWRSVTKADRFVFRSEILASLGDTLALDRYVLSLEGLSETHLRGFGRSEFDELALIETDERGCWTQVEIFAADQLAAALCRLYERHATRLPEGPARARADGAARALGDMYFRLLEREGLGRPFAADVEWVDHRVAGVGTLRGEAAVLAAIGAFLDLVQDTRWRVDDLLGCTAGALLARSTNLGTDRVSGGAFERHILSLVTFATDGRIARWETFDADRVPEALVRFDALTASMESPSIPSRPRGGHGEEFANAATRAMRAFERAWRARDWDGVRATYHPAHRMDDRRRLMRIAVAGEAFFANERLLFDGTTSEWRGDLVATRGERLALFRVRFTARSHDSGPMEVEVLDLVEVDAVGRRTTLTVFDPDELDAAWGELEARWRSSLDAEPSGAERVRRAEIATAPGPDHLLANAATATAEPVTACMNAHDWQGFAQFFADDFHLSDRRRVVQLELDRDRYVAFTREVADGRAVRGASTPLATRGERLALARSTFHFADADVGPSEIAFLNLTEVDARGRIVAYVRWDLEDLDAAHAELDRRYAAGEGAFSGAWTRIEAIYAAVYRGDREACLAQFAPDFHVDDHRRLGWGGMLRDADVFFRSQQALVELAPDLRYRVDHFATRGSAFLTQVAQVGTRDGGAFESPFLYTGTCDAQGRPRHYILFDVDDLDAALARFAALSAAPVDDPLAAIATGNAVTAAIARWRLDDGDVDWEALRASLAPGLVFEDRQGFARLAGDGELLIASLRERVASGARAESRLLGTAGERVAVTRMLWSGGPADGRFEIEYVTVVEVDAAGLMTACLLFDAGDARAARHEAWARWAAIDPTVAATVALAREANDAFNAQDRARLRALFADGLAVEDHRRTGVGRLEGGDAYVDSLAVLWDLAADTGVELGWFWLACDPHGGLYTIRRTGDVAGGGPFECDYLMLIRHVGGRLTRLELFELDQRQAALARATALARAARPDPPAALATPNAAVAAMDRWQAAFDAGDWPAVRALGAAGLRIEDRRRHAQISYDAEAAVADWRIAHAAGARPQRRLLGTAGERVALEHLVWSGGPPDGRYEIDFLWAYEVGEDGRITAAIAFDADDARAAQREAWARWAAIDPTVAEMTGALGEVIDAWNAEDLERLRASFTEDLVVEDHRRTGTGRSEGREAYLPGVQALWRLAPGARFEAGWQWLAIAPRAGVYTARRAGRLPDGGAFESDFLVVAAVAHGRTSRVEVFESDAADAALARFAALVSRAGDGVTDGDASPPRPDLLRIPPNAATRAVDQVAACADAGDWEGLRALCPRTAYEDRRPLFRVDGDGAMFVTNCQYIWGAGARPSRTLLATAGDRLQLHRSLWRGDTDGETVEVETLELFEVDAGGRIHAVIVFDPAERAAAERELSMRYLRSGAHHLPAAVADFVRALDAHDLAGVRATLPDDFVLEDHRRIGLGRIESADAYVASLTALLGLSSDARVCDLYQVVDAPHGRVAVARASGTNREGGEWEICYVVLLRYRAGLLAVVEFHELEDLDRVVERFAAWDSADA